MNILRNGFLKAIFIVQRKINVQNCLYNVVYTLNILTYLH